MSTKKRAAGAKLPERPNFEHLKKQAKDLLELAESGDTVALARFEEIRKPSRPERRWLTLASAQHLIALSYGFSSWALLKQETLRQKAERLKQEGLPENREHRLDLLMEAIGEHDVETVRVLLSLDASLAEGWGERKPLGWAAEQDLPAVVDLLLDAGASLEPDDWPWPHTALSWSITTRSLRAAKRLVERGASVDLWCAAGLGDVERMHVFFDPEGKPIPGASRHGATRYDTDGAPLQKPPSDPVELVSDALYVACRNGQLEAARFLLERGANPAFEGFARAPALHWAAFSGNRKLVELLLEHGADPEQKDGHYGVNYRQFAVRNPIEWAWLGALERSLSGDLSLAGERDASWGPPLHAAAEKGLHEHLRVLLEAGADPRELDHRGRTVRQCAKLAEDSVASARVLAVLEAASDPQPS